MNIYLVRCEVRYGFGAYREIQAIVTTETPSKALGWALMKYDDTKKEDWTIEQIESNVEGVTEINDCSN